MDIKLNLENLKTDISQICKSCGRDSAEIKLVAVSKTKPVELIKQAYECGVKDFGENYIQEAETKSEQLKDLDINWHVIGPVQTNKVKHITRFCSLLHSLDREALAEALQKRLEFENKTIDALIQINTSGEATKSGISPEKLFELAKYISTKDRIKIKGLMTIAENTDDENSIRRNYKQLKQLFNELKVIHYTNFDLKELSMGMSSDYKIAIEEGATLIRIGSTIFGARDYKKAV